MTATHPATTQPVPRRVAELVGIQYLRGIAAMMVVVFHLQPQLARMGYDGPWLPGLSGGVDVFFVISGFIMWVTTAGRPVSTVDFWRRRIVRIVPLYWLVTTFMVAMMLVAPNALQTSRFDLGHVVSSYLFVPFRHPVKDVMEPVVMPGWTLNYEMFFYLVFGLFLMAPLRTRLAGMVGVLALLVAVGVVAAPDRLSAAGFYTDSVLLEFAFGMLIGEIATRTELARRVPPPVGWAMVIGGLALVAGMGLWGGALPRALVGGLPSAAVVLGALIVEARRSLPRVPVLRAIGDASFSIYLSHVVTMSAVSQAWRRLHPGAGIVDLVAFGIVAVAACAVVGWLCYRFVEMPLIRLFRDRGRSGAEIRPASA